MAAQVATEILNDLERQCDEVEACIIKWRDNFRLTGLMINILYEVYVGYYKFPSIATISRTVDDSSNVTSEHLL